MEMEQSELIKRYFLVIAELHKMGYELIRVCPCLSPNGMAWRCATTVKKYTLKKCGAIYHGPAHTAANNQTGSFRFGECENMNPHEIAVKFLEYYPHLAKWGKGNDSDYVIWFLKAAELAQLGYFFYAFSDMSSCFNNKHKMLLLNNPPENIFLPFPPAGEIET